MSFKSLYTFDSVCDYLLVQRTNYKKKKENLINVLKFYPEAIYLLLFKSMCKSSETTL